MDENPQPELPADLRDPTDADFTGGGEPEDELAQGEQSPRFTLQQVKIAFQQIWKQIQGHPATRVIVAIGGVLVIVFAIYDNSGLREAYPIFSNNPPTPAASFAFPPAVEGETLIVIAEFVHREGADDTDPAGEIAIAIRTAAKKLGFSIRFHYSIRA